MGATILGSMKSRLDKIDADLLMAVNIKRPFTSTVDEIIIMASELQEASKLKITGFINNSNLLEQTTADDIFEGERILLEVQERTGIPLIMTSFMEGVLTDEQISSLKAPSYLKMTRAIRYAY